MGGRERLLLLALMAPAAIVFAAFFLLPLVRLFVIGGTGPTGWSAYLAIVTDARSSCGCTCETCCSSSQSVSGACRPKKCCEACSCETDGLLSAV